MLAQLHLVQRFVYQPFLPEEGAPGLQIMPTSKRLQKLAHFSLIQLQKIHDFAVLLSTAFELLLILVLLSKLEQRTAESLHHSRNFLLQHSRSRVGVDQDDHLIAEVSQPFKAKSVHALQKSIPSRNPVDCLGEPELRSGVDDTDHR